MKLFKNSDFVLEEFIKNEIRILEQFHGEEIERYNFANSVNKEIDF